MREGANLIKIYCERICKCHNIYLYFMLMNKNAHYLHMGSEGMKSGH
jgi:hypothetical protein